MDPPDPHGGGVVHALTPINGNVASQLTEALGVPNTPTLSTWHNPGLLGTLVEEYDNKENQQVLSKAPDITAGLKGRGLGVMSKNQGIAKTIQQAPPRPLVARESIRDIYKQF
jgi:hypothetical protein